MGVVSNGMLCSGDELRLTGDADGILILPADTPLGVPLADLYGDVVLDVDVKPNRGDALCLVGLAREVAAVTGAPVRFPEIDARRGGRPGDRRSPRGRRGRPEALPAVRRPLGRRRPVGPSPDAVQMRLLAAGMRPVSNVVDATNYVDARARQADPRLRRRAAPWRGTRPAVPACGSAWPRPASASRRSTTSSASSLPTPCSSPTPAGRSAIAGVMGGASSEVSRRDHRGHHRVGRLRPREHPPDRLPLRAALRGEPALREGPGGAARPDRRRPRGRADRRLGRRRRRPRAASTRRPVEPARGPRRLPAGTGQPAARDDLRRRASRRTCCGRVGIGVEAGRSRRDHRRRGRREAAGGARRTRPRSWPWSRPGAATSTSRPTSPRRSPASAATTRCRRRRPTRRCRTSGPTRWSAATRCAVRSSAPASPRCVTPALVPEAQAARLRLAGRTPPTACPGPTPWPATPIRVRNPLSERHAVLRSGLVGSLLDVLALNERHGRRDVAIFEVGKGYARAGRRHAGGVVAPRLPAGRGRRRRRRGACPGRPCDVEDAKAVAALVARVVGAAAPAFGAARDGAPLHPGRAARGRRRPGASPGSSGELHPDDARGVGPARRAGPRRRAGRRGPGRRASWRPSGSSPRRHASGVERDLARRRRRGDRRRRRGRDAPRGRRRPRPRR